MTKFYVNSPKLKKEKKSRDNNLANRMSARAPDAPDAPAALAPAAALANGVEWIMVGDIAELREQHAENSTAEKLSRNKRKVTRMKHLLRNAERQVRIDVLRAEHDGRLSKSAKVGRSVPASGASAVQPGAALGVHRRAAGKAATASLKAAKAAKIAAN